jgi:hypothetical protein
MRTQPWHSKRLEFSFVWHRRNLPKRGNRSPYMRRICLVQRWHKGGKQLILYPGRYSGAPHRRAIESQMSSIRCENERNRWSSSWIGCLLQVFTESHPQRAIRLPDIHQHGYSQRGIKLRLDQERVYARLIRNSRLRASGKRALVPFKIVRCCKFLPCSGPQQNAVEMRFCVLHIVDEID